jgi:hypothetical protein
MNRWMRVFFAFSAMAFCVPTSLVLAQGRVAGFASDETVPDDETTDQNRRRPTDDEIVRQRQRELLLDFDEPPSLDHGQSVHPRLMKTVKDNTEGIRFEEREAYLRVLRLATEVPLRRQQQFAADLRAERRELDPTYKQRKPQDFPQFYDLFMHPEYYRGRPVTLRGTMRKLTKFELGKNSVGLDQAYEGWVYPSDSKGHPAVVVFTSKDDRLPVKGDIQEEVEFTGYFFKMYRYDAQDVSRRAPLILAAEVEWIPHPYKAVYKPWGIEWYALATLGFLLTAYVIWQVNRKEMPPFPPMEIEPDFTHFPPREHPAPDPLLPHSVTETEDS